MTVAREKFQLVAGPNGLLYAIGGYTVSATTAVEAYNITSNTWTAKAPMPSAVLVYGATLGPDGLIYVFGGSNTYSNNSNPYYNTVYSYYPPTNTWYTNTQNLPTARRELSAATSSYNHRMYVIGGAYSAFLTTNEQAALPTGKADNTTLTFKPSTSLLHQFTSFNTIR